jgi:cardiolipin synthase
MYDSVGSSKTPKEFFKEIAAGGVEVVEFNPASPATMVMAAAALTHRDHRKLTIVDGRLAFLGGINISGVYGSTDGSSLGSSSDAYRSGHGMGGSGSLGGSSRGQAGSDPPFEQRPWRDTQVRIEGPVVADLQRAFLKQWERQKKAALPEDKRLFPELKPQGPHVVRAIEGSPEEGKGLNDFYLTLISAIECAETEVRITNAYFVPHQELLKALKDAAKRGVDVKLILPSRTDSWLVFHAGRSYYEELLEAGVKIFERKTRLLHAKTAVIDGVWSTVGSTNLDWRSLMHNDELNAVILGTEFAVQMNTVFDKDIANSGEITLADWRDRPIQERLKEAAARAWSRVL